MPSTRSPPSSRIILEDRPPAKPLMAWSIHQIHACSVPPLQAKMRTLVTSGGMVLSRDNILRRGTDPHSPTNGHIKGKRTQEDRVTSASRAVSVSSSHQSLFSLCIVAAKIIDQICSSDSRCLYAARLGGGSLDLSGSALECDNRQSLCEFGLELDDEVSSKESDPQSDHDTKVLETGM